MLVLLALLHALAVPPAAHAADFRAETIYFVMTARFNDGDPANNFYDRDRIDPADPDWRGDFKGLIARLDYIKDLGFTALWITPPVENRSGLSYHGYHAYDWNRIDPRLESPGATYRDLIREAHARGLKIVQDVVINHSSSYGIRGQVWVDRLPLKYFRPQSNASFPAPYLTNLGNYQTPFREDNDNPVAPAWFRDRQTRDPEGTMPLVDPATGQTVPQPGYRGDRFFATDAQKLDGNWYHLDGWIMGGDWENPFGLQQKHMAGDCLDLATERANVRDYLNQAVKQYLDWGVDAIRLDTAKHIERDELLNGYVHEWQRYKPGLFVFGEVLVKGTGWGDLDSSDNGPSAIRPWWYTRLGHDPRQPNSGGDSGLAVLDFSLFSTFRDNLTRGSFGGIGGVFGMDWVYGDATKLVTFFQNHDLGPDNDFRDRFGGDEWKQAVAYNLLWTARGIPALYQGEEIQFQKGYPQDVQGSNDHLAATGRAYYGDHLTDAALPQTMDHPLYRHIKRLNAIRHAVPSLQSAPMSQVQETGDSIAYVRDGGTSYAVVALTTANPRDFAIGGVRNGRYADAVSGREITVQDGTLRAHVEGKSAGIYVLAGTGAIGDRAGSPYLR